MADYKACAIGRTGGGDFGHGLHTCYKDVDQVTLVAVSDEDEEGREAARVDAGAERSYADYREMLEKEKPDIVSVCPRWVDCHEEMVLASLGAGAYVYCEKPLASDLASADRICEAVEKTGRKVAIAHQAVYLPQIQRIKAMIEEGRIGDVVSIYSAGKCDRRGGGEDMMVLGTHTFNLMRYFVGDVAWMFARVTQGGRDIEPADVCEAGEPIGPIAGDRVHSFFAFESGVTATFESRARQTRGGRPYGVELIGSEGRIAFNASANEATILEDEAFTPWAEQARKDLEFELAPLMDGNRLAILSLVDSIEKGTQPCSSAFDARAALEMIVGAYASQIAGGRVELPLSDRTHPLDRLKGAS